MFQDGNEFFCDSNLNLMTAFYFSLTPSSFGLRLEANDNLDTHFIFLLILWNDIAARSR
jgi:hypothetical protein